MKTIVVLVTLLASVLGSVIRSEQYSYPFQYQTQIPNDVHSYQGSIVQQYSSALTQEQMQYYLEQQMLYNEQLQNYIYLLATMYPQINDNISSVTKPNQEMEQNSQKIVFENEKLIEAYGILSKEFNRLSIEAVKVDDEVVYFNDRIQKIFEILERIAEILYEKYNGSQLTSNNILTKSNERLLNSLKMFNLPGKVLNLTKKWLKIETPTNDNYYKYYKYIMSGLNHEMRLRGIIVEKTSTVGQIQGK